MHDQAITSTPPLPFGFRNLADLPPFGRWAVKHYVDFLVYGKNKQRYPRWLCVCSCGTERIVMAQSLESGVSQSCGCLARELLGDRCRKHGKSFSPEYVVLQNMKKRCFDTTYRRYKDYGARGVTICARWRGPESFPDFLADVGPRPSPKHSIERKNNEGSYTCGKCEECTANGWPANCEWAVRHVQDRNKRTNHLLTFQGETLCLRDWADRLGIKYTTLCGRLQTGWTIEDALTFPPDRTASKQRRKSNQTTELR